jgi:hypothetical protein
MDGRSVGVSRALRRVRAPGSVDNLANGLSRKVWKEVEPEAAVGHRPQVCSGLRSGASVRKARWGRGSSHRAVSLASLDRGIDHMKDFGLGAVGRQFNGPEVRVFSEE